TPASAGTAEGVALAGTVKLLALRAPDPAGGLPWGLRIVRTSRGLTCADVGRVDYGTVGVLGQDGTFGDDGKFHPLSPDFYDFLGCDATDAAGHAFVNVDLQQLPASGLWGGATRAAGGCQPAQLTSHHALAPALRSRAPTRSVCPAGDMREAYFGLLGPQARSITYVVPGGGTRTARLLAPYGAYLLVFREDAVPGNRTGTGSMGGPGVESGEILAITYADGHTCRVPVESLFEACPPVGFVAPRNPLPTARELATRIGVRLLPARRYCSDERSTVPCEGAVPRGYRSIPAGAAPSLLVRITFRAHAAVASSASFYETELRYAKSPGCDDQGANAPTDYDVRAGQIVVVDLLVPYSCPGPAQGWVEYVPASGATTSTPVIGLPGQGHPITAGRLRFHIP
ncbi:MAG TPA: hypothetical protein VED41_11500, partial [Solirubrobacteraceae bacterium]|nr:hypothetical protein [Solirubrobacteraceae bacterium]